jgi:hypothetical protein
MRRKMPVATPKKTEKAGEEGEEAIGLLFRVLGGVAVEDCHDMDSREVMRRG